MEVRHGGKGQGLGGIEDGGETQSLPRTADQDVDGRPEHDPGRLERQIHTTIPQISRSLT